MSTYVSKVKNSMVEAYKTDPNINRVKSWYEPVTRRLPSATAEYLIEKVPVISWLPHYNWRWALNDVIAGITVGVMFIPQGLAYAKIANIPVEHGLYSCWVPSALYFFFGTSKELSSGVTSILGLLTAEVVGDFTKEGYADHEIASSLAFMVGVYTLAIGLLKLGFLLDFVSAPVLTGWISAVALVILLGQVDGLIGMDVPSGTAEIIRGILGHLNQIQPLTLAIGFTCIFVLVVLEQVGKRWGKKNFWLKMLCSSRAVVVLVLYTLISFLVNNKYDDPDDYKWEVTEVDTDGIYTPKVPDTTLLSKVAGRAFAPLIAMCVEHLGVGKAFGLRNNYNIDKSQELVFLGLSNLVNSFFGALPTGGAMSRTAVSSECGVRTPVNFLLTAAWILLTIYELSPALYWIPKATLSAIIIMAVFHLISPPRLFYRYYRMSFCDFVASMLGFWVTLFTTTEIGLGTAVGFNIVVTLLRLAFPRVKALSNSDTSSNAWDLPRSQPNTGVIDVPTDAFYVRFTDDLLFPNAERLKSSIVDSVKLQYALPADRLPDLKSKDRNWNAIGDKKIEKTRARKGINPFMLDETPLRHVVFDMTMVTFMDITGCLSLIELKMELRRYVGKELSFRFIGLSDQVKERFERAEWYFAKEGEQREEGTDIIYETLEHALNHREGSEKSDSVMAEKTLDV